MIDIQIFRLTNIISNNQSAWVFCFNHGIDDQQSVNILTYDLLEYMSSYKKQLIIDQFSKDSNSDSNKNSNKNSDTNSNKNNDGGDKNDHDNDSNSTRNKSDISTYGNDEKNEERDNNNKFLQDFNMNKSNKNNMNKDDINKNEVTDNNNNKGSNNDSIEKNNNYVTIKNNINNINNKSNNKFIHQFPMSIEKAIGSEFPSINTLKWGIYQLKNQNTKHEILPEKIKIIQRNIQKNIREINEKNNEKNENKMYQNDIDIYTNPNERKTFLDFFRLNKEETRNLLLTCKKYNVTVTNVMSAVVLFLTSLYFQESTINDNIINHDKNDNYNNDGSNLNNITTNTNNKNNNNNDRNSKDDSSMKTINLRFLLSVGLRDKSKIWRDLINDYDALLTANMGDGNGRIGSSSGSSYSSSSSAGDSNMTPITTTTTPTTATPTTTPATVDFTGGTVACASGAIDFIATVPSDMVLFDNDNDGSLDNKNNVEKNNKDDKDSNNKHNNNNQISNNNVIINKSFWTIAKYCKEKTNEIIHINNFVPESVRLFGLGKYII